MSESVAPGVIKTLTNVPSDQNKHVEKTSKTAKGKTLLYKNGRNLKRPLDRMYRPAPDTSPIPDLAELEQELASGLRELAKTEPTKIKSKPAKSKDDKPVDIAKTPPYISVTPPLSTMLSATAASALRATDKTGPKRNGLHGWRFASQHQPASYYLTRLLLLVIVGLSAALGYILADRIVFGWAVQPAQTQQTQQTQQAAPSKADAEWETAKQQWECALQQYQSEQQNARNNTTNAKETSCVNH